MNILVTGGSGDVGAYVVRDLLAAGHKPVVFDKRPPEANEVEYREGDILDLNCCRKACEGVNAIIHLAAIRSPLPDAPDKVLHVNAVGTYNVHQAAADVGVRRVAQASSDSTYGFTFPRRERKPTYLPVDEAHPQCAQTSYGLSKIVGELTAASFTDWYGLETACLRICYVWFPHKPENYKGLTEDASRWSNSLWVYNDARDAAQAFRLAVETEGITHECFCISAADTGVKPETATLLEEFYPDIPVRKPLEGFASLMDWSHAAEVLGYQPRHSWRDWGI